jgi:nicotinate-nucleotide adenylyltransferase
MTDRIGIFGGVFDPVHLGHISISRSFLKSNLINTLLVLPSPTPPHKENKGIASFHHRMEMLKLAYHDMEHIKISNLETQLPEPSYTLQTINYLIDHHPDDLFYLCIGEDSLKTFTSWYHYQEILNKISLLVAERPEVSSKNIPEEILEKSIFVDHKPVKFSSTKIRKQAELGLELEGDLPDKVLDYILNHHLYGT